MTFETLKQELRTFTTAEWMTVAIIVVAFTAAMETIGFVIGGVVGYIAVQGLRRERLASMGRESTDNRSPVD